MTRLCKVLNVLRQSYYKWVKNNKPIINNFNIDLAMMISKEHNRLNGVYGSIRLKFHLENKYGIIINHKTIRRYKNALNLKTTVRKRKPLYVKLHKQKSHMNMAPYVMNGNFKSTKPLQKLSTDVSYIQCTDGVLYLSAIKDLFNNEIISYSLSTKNDVGLIKQTLMGLPPSRHSCAIINSDQGALYYSGLYIDTIAELGYERSMSHRGRCWENSPIENWFSQIKEECLRVYGKSSMKNTREIIKGYVHWYNTERIQRDLKYLSPKRYKSLFI